MVGKKKSQTILRRKASNQRGGFEELGVTFSVGPGHTVTRGVREQETFRANL